MNIVSAKQMCKKIATFYLLHGLKIRLQDIVGGEKKLEYIPVSDIVYSSISEMDGSIVPYSFGKELDRFYLAQSGNGFGIVDSKMNRYYPLNLWNDKNLEITEEFIELMRKEELTEEEQEYIWKMNIVLPICEWASETGYRLFKLSLLE